MIYTYSVVCTMQYNNIQCTPGSVLINTKWTLHSAQSVCICKYLLYYILHTTWCIMYIKQLHSKRYGLYSIVGTYKLYNVYAVYVHYSL